MHDQSGVKRLAIFSQDLVTTGLVSEYLMYQGYLVIAEKFDEITGDSEKAEVFFRQNDPDLVICSIAPNYRENWERFKAMRELEAAGRAKFMLTTTDLHNLGKVSGNECFQYPVIEEPFELHTFLEVVGHAFMKEEVALGKERGF